MSLQIYGGAAVWNMRKREAFTLGASAEKQDGQIHLKILPCRIQQYRFARIHSIYVFTSVLCNVLYMPDLVSEPARS